MLNYALQPETWATTRLELEGRGVSWFVLIFLESLPLEVVASGGVEAGKGRVPALPCLVRAAASATPHAEQRRVHPHVSRPGPSLSLPTCVVVQAQPPCR
jgi:hypothetical protein